MIVLRFAKPLKLQIKDAEINSRGKSSSENEVEDDEGEDGQVWGRKFNISLLDQHTELKKLAEGKSMLYKIKPYY